MVRYDTRRENGLTRRDYHENAGILIPSMPIPAEWWYVWDWFLDLNDMVNRSGDGYCRRVEPGVYFEWARLGGHIVSPSEYDILKAMDHAYCNAMNSEISDRRARMQEQARIDQEARAANKGRR